MKGRKASPVRSRRSGLARRIPRTGTYANPYANRVEFPRSSLYVHRRPQASKTASDLRGSQHQWTPEHMCRRNFHSWGSSGRDGPGKQLVVVKSLISAARRRLLTTQVVQPRHHLDIVEPACIWALLREPRRHRGGRQSARRTTKPPPWPLTYAAPVCPSWFCPPAASMGVLVGPARIFYAPRR
jgi:hypothetical protein